MKPTKSLARLIEAAVRYGDAAVEQERAVYAWKRGDPPLPPWPRELDRELHSAARAYATSTRKQRKT